MKRSMLLYAALASLLTGCSEKPTQVTTAMSKPDTQVIQHQTYDAEAFFQTTSYSLGSSSGYVFSVDNAKILATSDNSGIFNVMTITTDGVVTPMTNSEADAHFAVSFFPNDDRILLSADQGGNELTHIYARELDGNLKDLTPSENTTAMFGGWRNDGEVFYIWTNERDPAAFDAYAYNPDDYSRELIFENPGFVPSTISADGRWIALDRPITSANSDIYVVSLDSEDKAPKLITEHQGNIAYATYAFSADSKQLILATNEFGEFNQAWTYELETGKKTLLIEADWDVSYVTHSPSGRYQVHALNIEGLTIATVTDLTTGKEVALPGVPEGELGQVRFSRDEYRVAFGLNTDTSPYNLYTLAFGKSALRLTDALTPEIDEKHLVTATVERFESFDGVVIPGIMYKPKQASKDTPVPAVVFVHGGPGGQSTPGYSPLIQHLVNNGYGVYAANNRGSSGYGKTFFHMDDKRHGEEDLKDIVAAGDYLRGLDWVNPQQVGVMGESYGGYITAAALTFHPQAFEVGVNIFGVTNWVRTLESIPPWWGAFRDALYDEMGDPATDAERHRAISPLFHAKKIVKPMLVVQGANDPRVLQIESDELVEAVRSNGVPVEYVVFDDEGHGFLRRENRITASKAYVDFLDKFLKGSESAPKI